MLIAVCQLADTAHLFVQQTTSEYARELGLRLSRTRKYVSFPVSSRQYKARVFFQSMQAKQKQGSWDRL
jgi:hypothetical protein